MPITVLIVDDSRLARMAVIKGLAKLRPQFAYVEAPNPDEAITMFNARQPSIAIVDFNMPVRDGLALTTELMDLNPGMPVALVSANTQEEILDRAAQLGATFLTKPLNEAALGAFLDAAEKKLGS